MFSAERFGHAPGSSFTFANVCNGRSPVQMTAYLYDATDPTLQSLMNEARDRASSKISDQALYLATLKESRAAMELLTERLGQLVRIFRAIKRGRFGDAMSEAGLIGRKYNVDRRRWAAKSFANRSLELAFGWGPLASDVRTAMDVLDRDFDTFPIRGRSSYRLDWVYNGASVGQTTGWSSSSALHRFEGRCEVAGYVRVSNPNLYLASRLGIANIPGTAWELVPWSFVVDYFANVGQYLGQFSEFAGLSFVNAYHSFKTRDVCSWRFWFTQYGHLPGGQIVLSESKGTEDAIYFERKLGIPAVTLQMRKPWKLSAFRALTSISLLIQMGVGR